MISLEELQKRLKLNSMRVYLQDYNGLVIYKKQKRLLALVNVESCQVGGGLYKGQPKKTRNEATRKDLKKRKVNMGLAKNSHVWKSFKRNHPTYVSMKKRYTNLVMI